ncbi:WD repeat-containing protein 47 isoform X8 [Bicyclus anynana]|uniref:WD repeat-containing protein 47 isoform X8 n=1 Tax=Bicyclus anynana TaxID=110368 RepID=A0A6J1NDK6_BICAN|nr:WD repeat-containing protein 47 isoform X8 [Bicyclus anynana]
MTAVKKAIAMRQLDSMFGTMTLEGEGRHSPLVSSTIEHDPHCDVHGRCSTPYRSSLYLHSRESTPGFRESVSPTNGLIIRRRGSLGISGSPSRDVEQHPSTFPSILRRDRHSPSQTPPRRDTPSPTQRYSSKRHSMGSFPNLSRSNIINYNRRDSLNSTGVRDMKRDYVGSLNSLSRKSSIDTKKSSSDSLDMWQSTWDIDRHTSHSILTPDERLSCAHYKTMGRNGGPTSATRASDSAPTPAAAEVNNSRPTFKPVTLLEDLQAVRCAEFHPNGNVYAVGSNTKTLRICTYPKMDDFKNDSGLAATTVLMKRTKHHKGSIYCMAWSPAGDLLATGSNDKTVKMMKFNSHTSYLEGQEMELTMHDGTIRDLCFIEDTTNKASLLVSGGAGDCKVYVTDCATGKTFQSLSGHTGHVLALYNWGGAMFVSGSQDKTVRFWDLRVGGCVNVITPPTGIPARVTVLQSTAVGSLTVDPSGRLLVCGHEDGSCALHDVRGSRTLHRFMPHGGDVRSVRFSPGAYYLLSAGYDGRVVLSDMQGDLTCPLPNVLVARHPDKVISARWHPEDFSFLSTSADKTAVLWTIPPI